MWSVATVHQREAASTGDSSWMSQMSFRVMKAKLEAIKQAIILGTLPQFGTLKMAGTQQ